jgi:hypothetical protein
VDAAAHAVDAAKHAAITPAASSGVIWPDVTA